MEQSLSQLETEAVEALMSFSKSSRSICSLEVEEEPSTSKQGRRKRIKKTRAPRLQKEQAGPSRQAKDKYVINKRYSNGHDVNELVKVGVEQESQVEEEKITSKIFRCVPCSAEFTASNSLTRHMLLHEGKIHPCISCSEVFTERGALAKHKKKVHDILKTLVCEECGKRYKSKVSLNNHVDYRHRGIIKFRCEYCQIGFSQNVTLTRHKNSKNHW